MTIKVYAKFIGSEQFEHIPAISMSSSDGYVEMEVGLACKRFVKIAIEIAARVQFGIEFPGGGRRMTFEGYIESRTKTPNSLLINIRTASKPVLL